MPSIFFGHILENPAAHKKVASFVMETHELKDLLQSATCMPMH